jgi:hypothetical protein
MRGLKKPLDRKKRRRRKEQLRSTPGEEAVVSNIGRPGIDKSRLLADRDALLESLNNNWERIGWRLGRARTLVALRKALHPLSREQSFVHTTKYFLITSTEKAKPNQIRENEVKLGEEVESLYVLNEKYNRLAREYDDVDAACASTSEKSKLVLSGEFNRRADEFESCERELLACQARIADLEAKLADQRAYFAQTELLRFKARGYAVNPLVFANAMAGLPVIGCRRSFELCSRMKSSLWPSHRFRVFKFIERSWKERPRAPERSVVQYFREAIVALPLEEAIEEDVIKRYNLRKKRRENYLRVCLGGNWRFLRLALDRISKRHYHPSVIPYLIASKLHGNIGKPRTREEVVLMEIESIKDKPSRVNE